MSVQSEINRINTAKTNLATSIENKGVSVPAGTSLSNFSSLVDQINTSVDWGEIGGTLSNQTDLQDALDDKQNTLSTDGHLIISEDVISLDQQTIDLSQCDNTESQFTYVNGTNDGTNWSTITIGGTTKNIPAGGSSYTAGTNIDITDNVISVTGTVPSATTSVTSGEDSIKIIPEGENEINIGGTSSSTTIYIGYRGRGSRSAPTNYVFGASGGGAILTGTATNASKIGGRTISSGTTVPSGGSSGDLYFRHS